jgi:cell division septation protein DedD
MDKRKTQRILGILVIIALVIILFPLLFNKNEVAVQTTSVTAPAFPDKQNPVTSITTAENQDNTVNTAPIDESIPAQSNDNNSAQATPEVISPPVAMDATPAATNEAPQPSAAPAMSNAEDANQPTELNNTSLDQTNATNITNEQTKHETEASATPSTLSSTEEENTAQPAPKPAVNKHTIKSTKNKTKSHDKPAHSELVKLNQSAWIVQMGSFKSKANARNLTDKLRAAGFNAFTRELKSAKGGVRTHVYVGPEFKEASATKISRKIKHDMNLQSIVLPYKPLAL